MTAKQQAQFIALRDAVKLAMDVFSNYAELHRAKGTPEGEDKAAKNMRYADAMRDALECEREP